MSETTKSAPAADTAAQAPTLTQMPASVDTSVADVIRDIFKQKDITLTNLSDLKLDNETSSERNCPAHIETASETGTISYPITMQGKEFQVLIANVDTKPLWADGAAGGNKRCATAAFFSHGRGWRRMPFAHPQSP